MRKLIIGLVLLSFVSVSYAKFVPDEGMWLPIFVEDMNYQEDERDGVAAVPRRDLQH
ncbi:MAG: hypothetical protein U5L09_16690 [Bacteroidales bacterium]|nr:hypothetical protein [Bacteroidales bacterium]